MNRMKRTRWAQLATVAIVAISDATTGVMAFQDEEGPGRVELPTVYRDVYRITVNGKPDANGTFSTVFMPPGEDGTEFTVDVVKGMGALKIAADIAKELTLADGSRSKVKHNGKQVVVKKANRKEKPLAIEMTNQKITDVSTMIGET